jgi:hypothetical protein
MSLCLQIVHEPAGSWSVHGLANRPVAYLPSLAASVDYARRECAEAPATIELMIDGFYAVVHQQDGWPRRLVASEFSEPCKTPEEILEQGGSSFKRWCDRVAGRHRH